MKNTVDARGKACPQPVIETKKALEQISGGELVTIVDNEAARDNVVKLAKSMSLDVEVKQYQGEYHIHINKGETVNKDEHIAISTATMEEKAAFILFTSNVLGSGSEELGKTLVKSFFYTLVESDMKPKTLMFINKGVYLTCEDSPVLAQLMALKEAGVEILSCGTCLDYYNLKDKLCVGSVTNMYTILENLMGGERVVTL